MYRYELKPTEHTDPVEWWELQKISREALTARGTLTPEEIDHFVMWQDRDRYVASHRDPNTEAVAGGRYFPDQDYSNTRVVVASVDYEPIGFLFGADNVSGKAATREVKRLLYPKKIYLWLGGAAVHPEHQRRGVGTEMLRVMLESGWLDRPVTAYTDPEENPSLTEALIGIGFTKTDNLSPSKLYGPDGRDVVQARLQLDAAAIGLKALDSL